MTERQGQHESSSAESQRRGEGEKVEERPEEVVPEDQTAEGLGDVPIGGEGVDDPAPRERGG